MLLRVSLNGICFPTSFSLHGLIVWHEHGQHGQPDLAGRCGQRHGLPVQHPEEEEACAVLAGAGLRAGATLQAAEIPVGAGEGAPGQHDPPDPDPGEDLVPKPPLQDEEAGERQGVAAADAAGQRLLPAAAAAAAAVPAQGGRAGAGERREAVPRQRPHAHIVCAEPPPAGGQPHDHVQQRVRPGAAPDPAGGEHRSLTRLGAALFQPVGPAEPSGRPLPPQLPRGRVRLCAAVLSSVIWQDVVTRGDTHDLKSSTERKQRFFFFSVKTTQPF